MSSALQAHHQSRVNILQLLLAPEMKLERPTVLRLYFQISRAAAGHSHHLNRREWHRVRLIRLRRATIIAVLDEPHAVVRDDEAAQDVRVLCRIVAQALLLALDEEGRLHDCAGPSWLLLLLCGLLLYDRHAEVIVVYDRWRLLLLLLVAHRSTHGDWIAD